MLSLLVAMSENHVIGKDGKLPWHLPSDLKFFKDLTMGQTVVMGRKTYLAIGRPLPGRRNVVLTRDRTFFVDGCEVIHSLQELQPFVRSEEEVFVIGGAGVFSQVMRDATKLYLTVIWHRFVGDVKFEFYPADWELVSRTKGTVDEKNQYAHDFFTFIKRDRTS
ncbi:dihydrofolate reductase [Alicyclobacillus fastidiosus]|uniref:Dihydrofolate reductase n=1 Tax=Alicyclobacillus fastidiosus TaxID=392011 RepID=A0ABY6ZBT1_9BACL|nr:dihydrofolate reductase [Alicyclobacillus fastidiosus]WAH39997.1 dihydrofolate reductase [Alicyclobacillus fastidiosus]GMA61289.1 dihydrofolate reductase [Alicyclobacillus fastidiosus]